MQIGIVSWGIGCAFPGVYAEVNNASILEFISSTIGGQTTTEPVKEKQGKGRTPK